VTPALEVGSVSYAFGPVQALADVSLTVPAGAFVALLGVNGAGKSTLVNLITRLYPLRDGSIRVAGFDLRDRPSAALARMGVVFQSRALDADLTVAQNLAYHAALHGLPPRIARARSAEVLAEVDLSDRLNDKVARLSGGQVRRAEIARALLHRPGVLILDEPTVGLDVKSRADVLRLTRRLATEQGVGVLWATHLFDEVAGADGLVLLHQGRVLWSGPPAEFAPDGDLTTAFLHRTGAAPEAA